MAAKSSASNQTVDGLLKSMLVFSRIVDHVLGTRAVEMATKVPLSASKVQVLRLLGKGGPQTSTQVARFLGVSKPAVSQIIDAMVRNKQVIRQTGITDRREVNLRLTEKGRSLLTAVQHQQRHYLRSTIRNLSGKNPGQWMDILHSLSKGLAEADDAYKNFCLQCGAHDDGSCVLDGGDACCPFLEHDGKTRPARKKSASNTSSPKKSKSTRRRSARR